MGTYEALWAEQGASFKSIAEKFKPSPMGTLPSDFVEAKTTENYKNEAFRLLEKADIEGFGICVHGTYEYLDKLRDLEHPIELIYYKDYWDLASSPLIAVIGTRNPSNEGIRRTRKLVKWLVAEKETF